MIGRVSRGGGTRWEEEVRRGQGGGGEGRGGDGEESWGQAGRETQQGARRRAQGAEAPERHAEARLVFGVGSIDRSTGGRQAAQRPREGGGHVQLLLRAAGEPWRERAGEREGDRASERG